jgi:serine/threonine-protein kinase
VGSRVGTRFGKYDIRRLLGKGGMGEVYEAYDSQKGRTVALKILAEELSHDVTFRTRFQRESQAAAILQEPHVIPIHDWGEIDGNLYIDMRLVQGQTLADLVAKGPLTPQRAVAVVRQVAAALDAAHAEGLIHRDVKPQNIIVTSDDFAYLVDFGITESRGDARLTQTGTQIGTFLYMAPERFGDRLATSAVDVYALACVLFESLTGELPFADDNFERLVAAHLSAPPPRPSVTNPRVPAAFDDVVARGMAKDPDDRYGTAGGLGRAAQRALQSGGGFAAHAMTVPPSGASPHDAVPGGQLDSPGFPTVRGAGDPIVTPRDNDAGRRKRDWLLPTVVAVGAALILGAIGVVIGLLVHGHSGPPGGTAAAVSASSAPASPSGGLPPMPTGPDQSSLHQTCDEGFALPNAGGFATHAGRGTETTSCLFAKSVLTSYWAEYGNASPLPRAVSAPGPVDCGSVPGALCNGSNFLLQCQQFSGDSWITCSGGSNARVYLW